MAERILIKIHKAVLKLILNFIVQDNPSENHVIIVRYIILVYGKTWFEAKWNSKLELGSLHLFHEVHRQTKNFSGQPLETVRRYTQWNGFFAHEEATLLYLACSSDPEEREVAVRFILKIRRERAATPTAGEKKRKRKSMKVLKKVRKFSPRPINWDASSVEELVSLDNAKFEPPLTMSLSDLQIQNILRTPLEINAYECISQFVEKGVKATTEAASHTTGADRQDALSINKSIARAKNTNITHKKHFIS